MQLAMNMLIGKRARTVATGGDVSMPVAQSALPKSIVVAEDCGLSLRVTLTIQSGLLRNVLVIWLLGDFE